jgi:predicted HTH transcriptional regulator
MERVGAGIRLMVNEMRQMDLPDPEFVEQHEFMVERGVIVVRGKTRGARYYLP